MQNKTINSKYTIQRSKNFSLKAVTTFPVVRLEGLPNGDIKEYNCFQLFSACFRTIIVLENSLTMFDSYCFFFL